MEGIKFLDTKKAFLSGMASISTFKTNRNLNSYKREIDAHTGWNNSANERLGRCWTNVGTYLHNAMNTFADQNNLYQPASFDQEIEYY